jgi:hypothetical protein
LLLLKIGTNNKTIFGGLKMDENSPEQLFNKMMEQHQQFQQFTRMDGSPTPKVTHETVEQQRILSELKSRSSMAPSVAPTQGQCPQCNLFHPPLPPGQKCPNAQLKIEGIDTSKISDFLIKIKDILSSQLEQKHIKNFDKFGSGMIMTLMKYFEEYKDD